MAERMKPIPATGMPRPPVNYDYRVWAIEQYNLLAESSNKLAEDNYNMAKWIDDLPPGHQPPGWPENPEWEKRVPEFPPRVYPAPFEDEKQ